MHGKWTELNRLLQAQWRQLLTINPSDRRWQMPLASTLGHGSAATLIEARFFDTVLGCLVGLASGMCIHNARFRAVVARQMRRLVPARFGG